MQGKVCALLLVLLLSCGRPADAPPASPRSETSSHLRPDAMLPARADAGVQRRPDAAVLSDAEAVRRRVMYLPLTDSLSSQVTVFDVVAGTKETLCGDEIAKHAPGWTQFLNPSGPVPVGCNDAQPGYVVCVVVQQNTATTYARLALFFRVPEARLAGVYLDTKGTTDTATLQSLMKDLRDRMEQPACP